ncbi:hypothetical protein [Inhella gelatinilytica]|uniref:Lipoprotein n=1 Tax=Inhella gelatinilytica TaxID=2795030 RepID=A0A931IVT2_9BURK|nr:hypothetical protein [Inhella gelatinilytica]MBH9551910.1 hypothetical protein [Inhella gelatinilytica]
MIFPFRALRGAGALLLACSVGTIQAAAPADDLAAVTASTGAARRDGAHLTLSLKAPAPALTLSDRGDCSTPDACTRYRFKGLSPNGQYARVDVHGYEWGSQLWINRNTGRQTEVFADPVASPSGRYLVVANGADCCEENGVFIWEQQEDRLVPRFALRPKDYALYATVRWEDEQTVRLRRLARSTAACPHDDLMSTEVLLRRQGTTWRFVTPTPAVPPRCGVS